MTMISKKMAIGVLATSLIAHSGASAFAAPQTNAQHGTERFQTPHHYRHGKLIRIDSMQRDGGHTGAPKGRAYDPYNGSRSNYN